MRALARLRPVPLYQTRILLACGVIESKWQIALPGYAGFENHNGGNNVAFTLVDTDILIDSGRGDQEAIDCLQRLEQLSSLATSVVTQMELMVGCRNKTELRALEIFLQRFQILKLTEQISDRAVGLLQQYRLSHGLLIPDALIAAIALEHNESLITNHEKSARFRFIAGLNLQPYP